MRKTKEEAELTRAAILDAAERVFFEQGVAGGTLEEIARVAGVTRGAVYWHFDNKAAIFLAIAERAVLPHEHALQQIEHHGGDDPLATLERCVLASFASYDGDHGVHARLTVVMLRCDYVGEMSCALAGHSAVAQRLSAQVTRYFRDNMAPTRNNDAWQPDVLARTLFALVHGGLLLWLRDPVAFPLARDAADGVHTFVQLVRARWEPRAVQPA